MQGLIDLHHHARPYAFFKALSAAGHTSMGGRPFPPGWTAAGALACMDEVGIATALLSAPDADLLYRDRPIALELSRVLNVLFAETVHAHPGRLGAFASLPMPHVDDALAETAYALDTLKLDGVMLSTSYDGEYLGHPRLDPLLDELNRRGCVVFVHPVSPLGRAAMKLDFPASLVEYVFDTTRCIANLLHREVPARFPAIRFIFSHGGGAAPFLAGRLSLMSFYMQPGRALRIGDDLAATRDGLRHFFYDTALTITDPALALLRETVGSDRLVFGSDYPQVPPNLVEASAEAVRTTAAMDRGDRDRIGFGNALRLFPRLTEPRR